jgi:hypothetical protein
MFGGLDGDRPNPPFAPSPTGVTRAGGGGANGDGAGATSSSCCILLLLSIPRGEGIGDGAEVDGRNVIPLGTFFFALLVIGGGTLNPPHFFFTEEGEMDVLGEA